MTESGSYFGFEHSDGRVKFKTLGELGEFIRGNGLQKKDLLDDGVPAIHYGQIHTHYGTWVTETRSFTSPDVAGKLRHARYGDLLIATTSEDDVAVAKATAWLGETEVVLSGDAFIYRHTLDPKYVAYFFQSRSFQDQKRKFISGTKVRRISGDSLAKIEIPVPSLQVQQEIASVLDEFSRLELELESMLDSELESRRCQYEHYRTLLMDDSDSYGGLIRLGDVFEMRAGTHIEASEISNSSTAEQPFPCFGGNGLRGYVHSYNYDDEVLFVGRQGALCGNVHRASGKIYATEHAVVVTPKIPTDISWAFHKLTYMDLNQYKTKSAQPGLAVSRLKELKIREVPLHVQREQAVILDGFYTLVNDLSIDLPAELSARRKQYEYYRDKLLTFKEISK